MSKILPKIPKDCLVLVCKIGQKEKCCRYILAGKDGFECGKNTCYKDLIDNQINSMVAKGDNCNGLK